MTPPLTPCDLQQTVPLLGLSSSSYKMGGLDWMAVSRPRRSRDFVVSILKLLMHNQLCSSVEG